MFDVMGTRIAFRGEETRRAWILAIVLSVVIHAVLLAWPRWPSFREIGGGDASLAARIIAVPEAQRSVAPASDSPAPDVVPSRQRTEPVRPAVAGRPQQNGTPPRTASPVPDSAAPSLAVSTQAASPAERESARPAESMSRGAPAASAAATPGTSSDIASVAQYRIVLMSAARRFTRSPDASSAPGVEGRVDVRLAIAADGSLARADVARSSGNAALDDLAVEILKIAKPHAPVPPALLAREFEVDVPVVFEKARDAR